MRHAQTNYNLLNLANSDPSVDVHLSDEGIEQAKNLAEVMKDINYDIVYVSELPRTKQTADIINLTHQKQLIVDRRLNDNKTGFEGKPVQEWLEALDTSPNRWEAKFNDGESLKEAAERGMSFIDDLRTKPYDSVLVVTHGFLSQAIFGYLENKSLDEASHFNLIQGTYAEFEL